MDREITFSTITPIAAKFMANVMPPASHKLKMLKFAKNGMSKELGKEAKTLKHLVFH